MDHMTLKTAPRRTALGLRFWAESIVIYNTFGSAEPRESLKLGPEGCPKPQTLASGAPIQGRIPCNLQHFGAKNLNFYNPGGPESPDFSLAG